VKRLLLLAALVALAGCETVPEPPVEVPVEPPPPLPEPVACVDPEQIPDEPPTVASRFNGDARHDLEILAPSARALRQWGQDLRALLEGCLAGQAPEGADQTEGEAETAAESS
jgi:hypothetical protein